MVWPKKHLFACLHVYEKYPRSTIYYEFNDNWQQASVILFTHWKEDLSNLFIKMWCSTYKRLPHRIYKILFSKIPLFCILIRLKWQQYLKVELKIYFITFIHSNGGYPQTPPRRICQLGIQIFLKQFFSGSSDICHSILSLSRFDLKLIHINLLITGVSPQKKFVRVFTCLQKIFKIMIYVEFHDTCRLFLSLFS